MQFLNIFHYTELIREHTWKPIYSQRIYFEANFYFRTAEKLFQTCKNASYVGFFKKRPFGTRRVK